MVCVRSAIIAIATELILPVIDARTINRLLFETSVGPHAESHNSHPRR
jgi:hypothetical protein